MDMLRTHAEVSGTLGFIVRDMHVGATCGGLHAYMDQGLFGFACSLRHIFFFSLGLHACFLAMHACTQILARCESCFFETARLWLGIFHLLSCMSTLTCIWRHRTPPVRHLGSPFLSDWRFGPIPDF